MKSCEIVREPGDATHSVESVETNSIKTLGKAVEFMRDSGHYKYIH